MDQPVAIITGAGRGIGRATACQLARLEYRLMLASRTGEQLQETIQLSGAVSGSAAACPIDVTRADEVNRLVEATIQRFGRIDALVHCAGVAPVRSIADMKPDEWHVVLDTNLSSAFYLCHAAWPVFRRQGAGVVVLVSSMSARDPLSGFAAYGAAKAGLNLLALSAAREGESIGVRVHVVAPGAVETAMFRQIATPEQWPTEKTLKPAEVASVIIQCVQGDLRHTSGEVIWMRR